LTTRVSLSLPILLKLVLISFFVAHLSKLIAYFQTIVDPNPTYFRAPQEPRPLNIEHRRRSIIEEYQRKDNYVYQARIRTHILLHTYYLSHKHGMTAFD
jgi:hypothetical protein